MEFGEGRDCRLLCGGSGQIDRHGLMGQPIMLGGRPVAMPSEPLKKPNIRQLYRGVHHETSGGGGGRDREANEPGTHVRGTVRREHGQPIALPQTTVVEGVQPHCPRHVVA